MDKTPTSLPDLLRIRAAERGAHPLLRFGDETLTYLEVDERTDALARSLQERRISAGTRVGVALPNGIPFPLVWLAIAKLGAVMVPLSLKYRVHDLAHVLDDSHLSLAIGDADSLPLISEASPRLAAIHVGDLLHPRADGGPAISPALGPDTPINIQYTSGTTGLPKGCVVTHAYWLGIAAAGNEVARCGPDDVFISVQPFYYMDPQWVTVLAMLCGGTSVILPRFSASTFWQDVRKYNATIFYTLGTMPLLLLKQPENPALERAHRVRVAICSGIPSALHAEIERRFGFPWREAYGSTETGADLFVALDDAESVGSGAMGLPIATKEARVVDADGKVLGDMQHGELVLRGKTMMLGYWRNPEATTDKIRDGWLHTGDVVYRDTRGYYHIVGRLKDMIRRSSENIAAAEVEAVLAMHDDVLEAAAVGVPDEVRGEEVLAYLVLREGRASTPEQILAFVSQRLAGFKVPRYMQFVDSLPKTPSERVAKSELKRLAGRRYDSASRQWTTVAGA